MPNPLHDALLAPHAGSAAPFARRFDGTVLTYGDFHAMAGRAAGVLQDRGLSPGDRLVCQVGKSLEALAIYAACLARGVIFVPLNTSYTAAEVAYFVADATPALVVCDPSRERDVDAATLTLTETGEGSFAAAMAGRSAGLLPVERAPGDLAAFLYTSGTTGRSKGAMLTQENLLSNARALVETWRITGEDVLLHALPIFHAHGLFVAINTTLLAGASMIYLPRFEVGEVLRHLPDATTMMGVPTFYTRLLAEDRFTRDLAGHMRLFVSGSAPLLAETHRQFESRTGHRILERYGMTETGMNTSNPYDGERRAGTVGFPLPGTEVRIMDGEAELPRGEIGMIEVRGPNVFEGYWNMPEKTAEEKRPDGWFITGDLGLIDADGYVSIVGRDKDLVISGGYNVYPKEVEQVLDAAPGVAETAVIGVPHPDFGEGVVAVIVAEGEVDLDVVRQAAAQQLADYKRPKRYEVARRTAPQHDGEGAEGAAARTLRRHLRMMAGGADTAGLRQAVIDAARAMVAKGLNQGTSGNVSVRAGEAMLITPSGIPYEDLHPDMIARLPLAGGEPEGPCKPSTEWHLHRELYRARPAAHAVLHAHPVHCTALAMARRPIPACHYMVAAFGGADVPLAGYAPFGSEALSRETVRAMAGRTACLMANHGATVIGEGLDRALWRLEELETLARGYILSLQAGGPHLLSADEMEETLMRFADYGLRPVP